LSKGGLVRDGNAAVRLGVKGIPDTAETIMISRDILLAASNETRLHIHHIGSKPAVDLIKMAKENGFNITCDVTPYHFFFEDNQITEYDPDLKFLPPIGNTSDVQAVKGGLKDGTIDIISSDHSPYTPEEKNIEFDQAPYGAVGLEVAFAMGYTELVLKSELGIEDLLRKFTVNPAKVLGLPLGRLEEGAEADITILDTNAEWTVDPENFESLSSNTPLRGRTLRGKPYTTIVRGQVVMKNERVLDGIFPFKYEKNW
jgi:dihydroorotase